MSLGKWNNFGKKQMSTAKISSVKQKYSVPALIAKISSLKLIWKLENLLSCINQGNKLQVCRSCWLAVPISTPKMRPCLPYLRWAFVFNKTSLFIDYHNNWNRFINNKNASFSFCFYRNSLYRIIGFLLKTPCLDPRHIS